MRKLVGFKELDDDEEEVETSITPPLVKRHMLLLSLGRYPPTRLSSLRHFPSPPVFARYTTPHIRSKMSSTNDDHKKDEEKPGTQLDLSYTKERAEELKENIEEVQKEIDEAWERAEKVDGQVKVSFEGVMLYHPARSL